MIRKSLPLRVLAISFIVLALPLLIDSFIFFQKNYNESIADAERELREDTINRIFAISEIEPVKQVFLKELMMLYDIKKEIETLPNDALNKQLKEVADLNPGFEIDIASRDEKNQYKIVASSRSDTIGAVFTSYFQMARIFEKGKGKYFSYIYIPEEKRYLPYMYIARVLDDLSVLSVGINIEDKLVPILAQEEGDISYAMIIEDGMIFAATEPNLQGNFFSPIPPLRLKQIAEAGHLGESSIPTKPLIVIQREGSPIFEFIFGEKVQIAYQTYVPSLGIYFLAYSPKEAIFGKSIRQFLLIYTIYGFILIAGGAVAYWFSLYISRSLKQLSQMMGRVGEGDLSVKYKPAHLGYEINLLGEIFNETLGKLLENIKRAEDERVLKEIYKKELELGQEVQNSLLPQEMPKMEGVELASNYLSAEQAGGDFYDLFITDSDQLVLTVADAAGKGISTCLYSLGVRSLLRTHMTLYDDVGMILSAANNLFCEDTGESGMFATVMMGIYDPKTRLFSYYSCGHVSPIVRKANGQLMTLGHRGMAMGLKSSTQYQTEEVQLEPGDLLLIYTNGLVDVYNEHHHPFTENRLKDLLLHRRWFSASEVVEGLTHEVKTFVGATPQEEEVVILAMRVV
ncbi:MAG: Phosphoserine phosphatase RsbU [Chlamydiae bacterium]|nr:Phosphoserine phosphatase RsbU [Chlamydiota bacterium]